MQVSDFFMALKQNNIDFFCGVPDSLLKSFCAYIIDNTDDKHHIITANEGNAIGIASGYYLANKKPALVYMQNSGIGNCVNPLLSLCDEDVYNIPLLMFIGWRGEPDIKDEPQHIKQGKVTDKLLETMGIVYSVLPENIEETKKVLDEACRYMKNTRKPYAFIVKKNTFDEYKLQKSSKTDYSLLREEAICTVAENLSDDDIVVSTTGQISRELYEFREKKSQEHKRDFLTVGSMGHASSVATGVALVKPNRNVFCFDGDGAFLMHMGACPVIASKKLKNFKHIIFNNSAHDSVGAQPTIAKDIDFNKLAFSCGYTKFFTAKNKEELEKTIKKFCSYNGTALLEIKVKCGSRKDLGRPKEKPAENKTDFMSFLTEQKEFIGRGTIKKLSSVLKKLKVKKVLVFTDKIFIETLKNIKFDFDFYADFTPNPKYKEIQNAIETLPKDYDAFIAFGGGSVIDFAKAFRYYSKQAKPLIAIPTTAGTGSEATPFAVVYVEGKKNSLEDASIKPDIAIIDSFFSQKAPKYLKACSAMDAFCQGIESYWAVGSTEESKRYAVEAIKLCKKYLVKSVNTDDNKSAEQIAKAAHLAGKAIAISKTTASHALSYTITSKYGLPHGHAVSISIAGLFKSNLNISDDNCIDKRGLYYVKEIMQNLLKILDINAEDIDNYFHNLMDSIELEWRLDKLNINDIEMIINGVNLQRLDNNPKKLNKENLQRILYGNC